MEYKYTDKKTKEETVIPPERWQWGVIFDDETELKQFGSDGTFHRIGEVDEIGQDKIKLAVLYKPDDPTKRIDIVWQPEMNMKLIHKYRNIKPYYMKEWVKVYMWGYRAGFKDNYVYHYNFVLPDDRIIMSNQDNISLEKFELQRV
jgi:hypothetical protein